MILKPVSLLIRILFYFFSLFDICAAPIYENGQFIGAVTVTLKLDTMQDFISSIRIGEAGTATVVIGDGMYVASADEEKVKESANISGTDIGNKILNAERGSFTINEDGTDYDKNGMSFNHKWHSIF